MAAVCVKELNVKKLKLVKRITGVFCELATEPSLRQFQKQKYSDGKKEHTKTHFSSEFSLPSVLQLPVSMRDDYA